LEVIRRRGYMLLNAPVFGEIAGGQFNVDFAGKGTSLGQILRRVVHDGFQDFGPVAIDDSIRLEPTDACLLPGFFDRGRVDADLKHAHASLHALRRHALVFALEFDLYLVRKHTNFSFGCRCARFLVEQVENPETFVLNCLEAPEGFVACQLSSCFHFSLSVCGVLSSP
jgi:hypothetical protein